MNEGHTERLESALAGRYRIERKLGEGGMATVYLAEDVKHERKVALKILRPELAAVIGAERFLSEIKTTANLQHPHILPLFDSGSAEGYLYYVMPFIDGETLREKLDREKQLGVEESLRIARDVADALDYAHRQGVIHRDIKPGNILLHDGRPVVADFGIALAVSAAGGGRMTETGLSLGTPHYMSPEQASADRDLSARSDVYSLGCVLYEMIAGQPPHTGPSAQSILVRILTKDVTPLTELRHTVPPNVAAAVAKAIEKLPADRFESAREFRDALEDAAFSYEARPRTAATTATAPSVSVAPSGPWIRDRRSVAAVALGTALAALAALGWLRPAPAPGVATRADVTGLDVTGGQGRRFDISPDGRRIVAVGEGNTLYLRTAGDPTWRPLPNTTPSQTPAFSPDGQWVAFNSPEGIMRVPIEGGPALPVVPNNGAPHWGDDDQIVYSNGGAIYSVAATGGEPEVLFASDSIAANLPHLLPGGRAVVFGIQVAPDPLAGRILLLEIETGEVRELVASGNHPSYLPTGHLVYGHGAGALMAVAFDLGRLEVTGSPVTLIPDLSVFRGGASQFAVSETGTLVYGSSGSTTERETIRTPLAWVDLEGEYTFIPGVAGSVTTARVSPDGTRVAYDAEGDIWIHDIATGTHTQLTFEGVNKSPEWSADGRFVYFLSEREGTEGFDGFRQAADGSAAAEQLWTAEGELQITSVSPDGRWLALSKQAGGSDAEDRDIAIVPLDSADLSPVAYLETARGEDEGDISPDGGWMAYWSPTLGAVLVQDFPQPVGTWRVSAEGSDAYDPVWAPDGSAIYYRNGATLWRAEVASQGSFGVGRRAPMFDWSVGSGGSGNRGYDIHPDGDRFIVSTGGSAGSIDGLHIVTNWFTELRERMGS